jgi:glutaminase
LAELRRFAAAGVDLSAPDYDRRTALHVASSCGNVEAVKFLLDNGANPNTIDDLGNTPLSDALRGATKAKRYHTIICLS